MKARSTKLAVEALEDRCVPSTVAYGDFNNDTRMDMAAITSPTTIAVSLANLDGSYTVSAILSIPKNRSYQNLLVTDFDADGEIDDINAVALKPNGSQQFMAWLSNGDGTFDSVEFVKWKGSHPNAGF